MSFVNIFKNSVISRITESTDWTDEQKKKAQKSSRANGAVKGGDSLVTRYMKKILPSHGARILDYGSGHLAQSSMPFRESHDVHALDLSHNPEVHDARALERKDISHAMSSNCMNVHPSDEAIEDSVKKIKKTMKPTGHFVCNLPSTPRYGTQTADSVQATLERHFHQVKRVHGKVDGVSNSIPKSAPLFHCQHPKE